MCIPLVSSTGHGDAALHRVHYQEGRFALANLLVALFPRNAEVCDARYLFHFLNARRDRILVPLMQGTSNVSLKEKDIKQVEVPLPAIAEQRRVVARIEQVSASLVKAQELGVASEAEISALSPALLGSYFKALAKKYPVSQLGELATHIVDGPHQKPHYVEPGPLTSAVPFVTVRNMVSGKLDFRDLKYVSRTDHDAFSRRCQARPGDVLLSKDGATRGRPCFVDDDRDFSFFVSVALIKPKRDKLDGKYLVHLLNSSWIRDRVTDRSRGDLLPHIVLGEIRMFPVPLPSLQEQQRLAVDLDRVLDEVACLAAERSESTLALSALWDAVIDRALEGEV